MEVVNGKVVLTFDEYRKLSASRICLEISKESVEKLREPDGGLRLPPKCVELLLQIMEAE